MYKAMDLKTNHFHRLRKNLQKRNKQAKERLISKHRRAFEWASYNTRQLAAGGLGSLLLLSSPSSPLLVDGGNPKIQKEQFINVPDNLFMVTDVKKYLPDKVDVLLPAQEEKIAEILSSYYGLDVKNEIEGKRLIHTFGYIGAEQHLMRYPGDVVENMAPGRGAWGYFTSSKEEMTQRDIEREKYYIAVQTFRAPEFASRVGEYRDFFKYRKMLVVNPNTGKAMVVVVGDAGPAVWTGKQLGGSPEVMKYLERVDGRAKGPVLYFFINDPDDKVPLGPIEPRKTD